MFPMNRHLKSHAALALVVFALLLTVSGGLASAQTFTPPPPPPPPLPPPSSSFEVGSGATSLSTAGGTIATFAGVNVTFGPNELPANSRIITSFYDGRDIPTTGDGAGFRAPGWNNKIGIKIVDANGTVLHTLPAPGMNVCFTQVAVDAYNQTPESWRTVDWWNGSKWVQLPTTLSGPTNGFYTMCANGVTNF